MCDAREGGNSMKFRGMARVDVVCFSVDVVDVCFRRVGGTTAWVQSVGVRFKVDRREASDREDGSTRRHVYSKSGLPMDALPAYECFACLKCFCLPTATTICLGQRARKLGENWPIASRNEISPRFVSKCVDFRGSMNYGRVEVRTRGPRNDGRATPAICRHSSRLSDFESSRFICLSHIGLPTSACPCQPATRKWPVADRQEAQPIAAGISCIRAMRGRLQL